MHILLPSFLFPPFCSPGSMRLGRFAKRFVECGGRVTVVTAAIEDYEHGFPRHNNLDEQLVRSLPEEVQVIRTRPVRPGQGIQLLNRLWLGRLYRFTCTPDNTRWWHETAVEQCLSVHHRDPVDCIYTSSNPLSAHLIGKELAERLQVPWVAEFRDPWTSSPFKSWETKLHYRYEQRMEAGVLHNADHIIMNTPVARQQVLEAFPGLPNTKVSVVPNSFEPSIEGEARIEESGLDVREETLTIAHVGTMRAIVPNGQHSERASFKKRLFNWINYAGRYSLVHVDALGNSPWYFAQALRCVYDEYPEWKGKIRLVIAGRLAASHSAIDALIDNMGLPAAAIKHLGLLPHADALKLMRTADVLLVNYPYATDMRAIPCVPAKTYEYLGMGKPILGLLPPGDAREIVDESGLGYLAPPNSPGEIAQTLVRLYKDYRSGNLPIKTDKSSLIEKYRSDRLADQVWDIFLQVSNKNGAMIAE